MEMIGPALALAFVLKKLLDWARTVIPDHIEAKVLIPLAWVLGIVGAWALSTSAVVGGAIEVLPGIGDAPGVKLYHADAVVIFLYGFIVGSGAGVIHDAVKPNTPPHDGT